MLKVVQSKDRSVREQVDMEAAMRYAALEINFVDQRFPVSPRVRELVRLLPEVTHERHLTPLMLLEDRDLETVMKEIDRKALATNDFVAAVTIPGMLSEKAYHILTDREHGRWAYHAKWKPIELRAREAMQEAQYASFFLPGIPEKDPNTGGWRFDVHAVYRDIKISMGYVLVSKEKEVTVKLKDNWKGFFLENHILWLYKNSVAFFPG